MANDITRINAARSHKGTGVDTRGNNNANSRRNLKVKTGTAISKTRKRSTGAGALQHRQRHAQKPLDLKRVNTVRKAIARGNYSVDVVRLADKLLDIDSSKD
jgi:flagellar biosynthesis anti-sigma factor FlgM